MELAGYRIHLEYPQTWDAARQPQAASRNAPQPGRKEMDAGFWSSDQIALRSSRRMADNHLGLPGTELLSQQPTALSSRRLPHKETAS
jgi:hypothetical protein